MLNPFATSRSLATSLPALSLPHGLPAQALKWTDLALDHLLPRLETLEIQPPVTNSSQLDPADYVAPAEDEEEDEEVVREDSPDG